MNRVGLPDCDAVFEAGAVAHALDQDISEITLSRCSVRTSGIKDRREAAAAEEKETALVGPVLLHWNGKLLRNIDETKEVYCIAVIITGNDQEMILSIPKIERGTEKYQGKACAEVIEKWNLRSHIKGFVFDTTASNTGIREGKCITIEEAVGSEMLWIACRHRILETVLLYVFSCLFGATEVISTSLIKRFQKE